MIKAKTNKKIITILCAILSAVFALITGVTYCATATGLMYSSNPLSTQAYMGNNQYTLINDTISSPVPFGKGSHNFEIALKYAIDYDFDFRIDYSLQWKNQNGTNNSASTDNVILNFANRDNIIVDDNHIYYVAYDSTNPCGVTAGDGKITIISGVDYVDVEDETYNGLYLTINAEVIVYKETTTYTSTHELMYSSLSGSKQSIATSESAIAWLQYKNCKTASIWTKTENNVTTTYDAYVMLYNYRYDSAHGVHFPGARSAYNKTIDASNKVTQAKWLGGNRAYAGTGMYIITSSNAINLKVKVEGLWSGGETGQYENSIKFNYSNRWVSLGVDTVNKIHETCVYSLTIPAYSACYIEVLDNIEVVSAGIQNAGVYDSHRGVINQITINDKTVVISNNLQGVYIQNTTNLNYFSGTGSYTPTGSYSSTIEQVTLKNASSYANNLYEINATGSAQVPYYTNITLVNNTASEKIVNISDYKLSYRVSNGNYGVSSTNTTFESTTYHTDYNLLSKTSADTNGDLYYTVTGSKDYVVLAPYSSASICDTFAINSNFKTKITADYGLYDVWVSITPIYEVTETSSNVNGLVLETKSSGTAVTVSVKNNTNNVVSGISVSNLMVYALSVGTPQKLNSEPLDWKSSFWKYYEDANGETQVASYKEFASGTFYSVSKTYASVSMTNSTITSLNPGDSAVIATGSSNAEQFIVVGNISATTKSAPNGAMIIKNGTNEAFIVNESDITSYYVRVLGDVGTVENFSEVASDGYCYYLGILRPNQIINLNTSNSLTLDAVQVTTTEFDSSVLTNWDDDAINSLKALFSIK